MNNDKPINKKISIQIEKPTNQSKKTTKFLSLCNDNLNV
jgi:hypothetical protein